MHHHATAILLSTGALLAQASGGAVFALPHGFSIDPTTVLPGIGPGMLAFSDTGIDGTMPPQAPPPAMPDFAAFTGGAAVDVDAVSIGWDWIVSTPTGEAVVPPGQWAAITFTVTRATVGAPGSLIAGAATEVDGAAADVFAYVIPGSALPPIFVGVPFRAQDSTETSVYTPGSPGNLDAHDLYIALIYYENPQLAVLLPPPTLYFSVTAATVPSIPMAWTAVPALRSGATVFSTTWSPISMTWSPPVVAMTPASLGILSSEDLDALAVDVVQGRVLFSTSRLPPFRNPILYSTGTGVHSTYRLPATYGGLPISGEVGLGLGFDDIDGICALDPGGPGTPSQIRLPFMMSSIQNALPSGLPTQLQAIAWRGRDHLTNQEYAETWMTGWPPPGTPQQNLAIVGASVLSPFTGYNVVGVHLRPIGNPFPGHPENHRITIPASHSLTGMPLYFLWGALSQNSFDVSHPISILL